MFIVKNAIHFNFLLLYNKIVNKKEAYPHEKIKSCYYWSRQKRT